jgi:hypothetical protein
MAYRTRTLATLFMHLLVVIASAVGGIALAVRENFLEPSLRVIRWRFQALLPSLRSSVELVHQRAIRFGQADLIPLGVGSGRPARC